MHLLLSPLFNKVSKLWLSVIAFTMDSTGVAPRPRFITLVVEPQHLILRRNSFRTGAASWGAFLILTLAGPPPFCAAPLRAAPLRGHARWPENDFSPVFFLNRR